MLFMFS
jgi:hypothetical protein